MNELKYKNKKIVAITGCAAGIAHTYMAAAGIEKASKKTGAKVKVETHGASGHENVLTADEIKNADIVLVAAEIEVDLSRFEGKKVYSTDAGLALRDPLKLLDDAFEKAKLYQKMKKKSAGEAPTEIVSYDENKKSYIMKHVMFGVSWILPVIILGGICLAIGQILTLTDGWMLNGAKWSGQTVDAINAAGTDIGLNTIAAINQDALDKINSLGMFNTINESTLIPLVQYWNGDSWIAGMPEVARWGKFNDMSNSFAVHSAQAGMVGFSAIYPVLAGSIAYSISDKRGVAPGIIAGVLANNGSWIGLTHDGSPLGLGFFGAILVGLFAGYMTVLITKYKAPRSIKGIFDLLVFPLTVLFITLLVLKFVFTPIFGPVVAGIYDVIYYFDDLDGVLGAFILGSMIGMLMCIDLGGPINKITLTTSLGIFTDTLTSAMSPADISFTAISAARIAITVPPIMCLMTTLIYRKYFTQQEVAMGINAGLIGGIGITEPAIPFAASKPKVFVPGFMIAGAIAGGMSGLLQLEHWGGFASILSPIFGYVTIGDNFESGFFISLIWPSVILGSAIIGTLIAGLLLNLTESNQNFKAYKDEAKKKLKMDIKQKSNDEISQLKKAYKEDISAKKIEFKHNNKLAKEVLDSAKKEENLAWKEIKDKKCVDIKTQKASDSHTKELEQINAKIDKQKEKNRELINNFEGSIFDNLKYRVELSKFMKEFKKELKEGTKLFKLQGDLADAKEAHFDEINKITVEYIEKVR